MATLINQILTSEDLTKKRTPPELYSWWREKSDELYEFSSESRKAYRLHEGLAKPFMEELFPLSLFGKRKFGDIGKIFL